MALEQLEALADAGQHSERQHVDLQHAEFVEVVLVPLDHGAILHRRVLDRDQLVERRAGDDEAADMLRKMTRKADQLAGKLQSQAQGVVGDIETQLAEMLRLDAFVAPAPDRAGQRRDRVARQAHHLADVADRRAGAIMDDGGGDGRMVAAVFFVDILDHLLAPLMLEIDVNIGRLIARGADEAREQQAVADRIHLGDAKAVADHGIRGRAAALAQDTPGCAHR